MTSPFTPKQEKACLDGLRELEPDICDVAIESRTLLSLFEHHVYPLKDDKAELDGEQIEMLSFMIGDVLRRAEKLKDGFYATGWPGKGGAS